MKKIYYSFIGAIILFAFGCQKGPYPYISLNDVKKIDSAVHPAIKNVAFIYKNNIYYAADFDKPVVQITTDGSAVKFVKMSHDHSKFAYLNILNNIVVIDNKGNNITILSQYSQVKSFDWSADDKTLYILNGNAMAYYGPDMNLPAFTYPGIVNGSTMEVLSASVSMQGDFAYVVHGYNFFDGDKYELVIVPANNGQVKTYISDNGSLMDYVNFSSNKQDLVVGYNQSGNNSYTQEKLDLFINLNSSPLGTFKGASTGAYNSDINYIVGDFLGNNNNTIAPTAVYLGPTSEFQDANIAQNKVLTQFSSSSHNLYIDWK